ncbi:hypothetical protein GCM10007079_31740 [Nocardiopsis terrae]|uniref:DUF5753 domain-containing protein n=1 Tax=Nocardiopsis terrae TaxID=372655 RepID=A0ABR9HJ36_9ACTN|nr:Scr1 family TA system antitoxin-like transcriptional regulator [Nocardiopsis terrae]MBE1458996.1 hypothetical protein [Nocardiopsis terrae]GHC87510.1 hypothetical protein GCM10007079_31740 [Nocardiopsis terrae]
MTRAQLTHLHHLAQADGISVHLLPDGTGFHPGLGGAFWTLSFSPSHTLVYIPHPRGPGQVISEVSQVKSYTDLFATLQGAALPVEESRNRLVELASRICSTPARALTKQPAQQPVVEHRLAHGELPAWMHVAAQRRRTPAPVPRPRPAPDDAPTRPGPGLPPLPLRPRSHRKPRRKFGWFVTIYALATAAGALIQHVFSNLL